MSDSIEQKLDKIAEKVGVNPKPKEPLSDEIKAFLFVSVGVVLSTLLTLLSFFHLLTAFPLALGMVVVFLGLSLWLFADKYILPGNTIEKISTDAKAVALFVIAISIFYRTGVEFGNSYLSNPYGSNERSTGNTEQIKQSTNSNPPAIGNGGFGSQGATQGEQ